MGRRSVFPMFKSSSYIFARLAALLAGSVACSKANAAGVAVPASVVDAARRLNQASRLQ